MLYKSKFTIKLKDTDAAGVLFFPNLLSLAHGCYEEFLESRRLAIAGIIGGRKFLLPVVHADADYRAPMPLSRKISVLMDIAETGRTSFTLSFSFLDEAGTLLAEARTVHVSVDFKTGKAIPLPAKIRNALKPESPCDK